MPIKFKGFYPNSSEEGHLSLKVPLFEDNMGKKFIQKIDEHTNKIIGFIEVGNLEYAAKDLNIDKSVGEKAVYGLKFRDKYYLEYKSEIDKIIISLIETNNFTGKNLYSLYTFLGLPRMVVRAVDVIITTRELDVEITLTRDNFILLTANPFQIIVPDDVRNILINYLPVLACPQLFNYTDVISTKDELSRGDTLQVGTHKLNYNKFIESLYKILEQLDYACSTDKLLNDIIINILLIYRHPIPKKREILLVSNENFYSPDPLDNIDSNSVNDLFVRSSTSFYKYQPNAQLADESFVIKGQRVAHSHEHENDESEEFEISQTMNIQIDEIAESILLQNKN